MKASEKAKGIDVVILCGGKGERLRSIVNDRPKSMAEFNEKPFLSLLVEYVASFGFRRFILCIGYKGKVIREYFSVGIGTTKILYSDEKEALGTGGAIKKAKPLIRSNPFFVMNGDSFCRIDLHKFIDFHLKKRALLSIALVSQDWNQNSGKVMLDGMDRIIRFEEKKSAGTGHFDSAGIYLMDRDIFSSMRREKKFSLEYDFFPLVLDKRCYGFKQRMDLIDFGMPEGYLRAKTMFSKGAL